VPKRPRRQTAYRIEWRGKVLLGYGWPADWRGDDPGPGRVWVQDTQGGRASVGLADRTELEETLLSPIQWCSQADAQRVIDRFGLEDARLMPVES
jgi:hypothetical protein